MCTNSWSDLPAVPSSSGTLHDVNPTRKNRTKTLAEEIQQMPSQDYLKGLQPDGSAFSPKICAMHAEKEVCEGGTSQGISLPGMASTVHIGEVACISTVVEGALGTFRSSTLPMSQTPLVSQPSLLEMAASLLQRYALGKESAGSAVRPPHDNIEARSITDQQTVARVSPVLSSNGADGEQQALNGVHTKMSAGHGHLLQADDTAEQNKAIVSEQKEWTSSVSELGSQTQSLASLGHSVDFPVQNWTSGSSASFFDEKSVQIPVAKGLPEKVAEAIWFGKSPGMVAVRFKEPSHEEGDGQITSDHGNHAPWRVFRSAHKHKQQASSQANQVSWGNGSHKRCVLHTSVSKHSTQSTKIRACSIMHAVRFCGDAESIQNLD
jgi:hypothetical protein